MAHFERKDYVQRKLYLNCASLWKGFHKLQNSPYFCVFNYALPVKQKVWNEAENREQDWGETLKIRGVWGSRALRVQDSYATLYRFLYWFWQKNRLFCSVRFWRLVKPYGSSGKCEETLARELRAYKYVERACNRCSTRRSSSKAWLALITRVSFSFVQKHFLG